MNKLRTAIRIYRMVTSMRTVSYYLCFPGCCNAPRDAQHDGIPTWDHRLPHVFLLVVSVRHLNTCICERGSGEVWTDRELYHDVLKVQLLSSDSCTRKFPFVSLSVIK